MPPWEPVRSAASEGFRSLGGCEIGVAGGSNRCGCSRRAHRMASRATIASPMAPKAPSRSPARKSRPCCSPAACQSGSFDTSEPSGNSAVTMAGNPDFTSCSSIVASPGLSANASSAFRTEGPRSKSSCFGYSSLMRLDAIRYSRSGGKARHTRTPPRPACESHRSPGS